MRHVKHLIISDVHLGSEFCNAAALLSLLESYTYEQLIIVGDLFESEGLLNEAQFALLVYLRKHKAKIICIEGNHDPLKEGWVRKLLGVDVYKEYIWEVAGKKFLAIHGHQFDKICFVFNEPMIDRMFAWAVRLLKKVHLLGYGVKEYVIGLHETFSRHITRKVKKHAKKRKVDGFFWGHTHDPHEVLFVNKRRGMHGINCGGWVDDLCSYATVDREGNARLHILQGPVIIMLSA